MRNSPDPVAPSSVAHPVLSKTADYALRALLALARIGDGRPLPAETLAELTGAPTNYMGKTLNVLARAGLLRSARGPAGGFALAAAPESITIARIADVFAERPASTRCLLGAGPCDAAAPCAAHHHWMRVAAAACQPLLTTTLADLLADDARSGRRAVPTTDSSLSSESETR